MSPARSTNLAVARLFDEIARSLELAGQTGHRPRAYRRAARAVAALPEPLERLARDGRLRTVPGIGPSLEALIDEYLRSGAMRTRDRLVAEHPPGLAPLLAARGFGPAGVHALHTALGVTDLDSLEAAARGGQLSAAIGATRAADLLAQLPALRNPVRPVRLKPAMEVAHQLTSLLEDISHPRRLVLAGDARRMCPMIERGLDLLSIADPAMLGVAAQLPGLDPLGEPTDDTLRLRQYDGPEVRLHVTNDQAWGAAFVWHTGSAAHLRRLQTLAQQRGLELDRTGLRRDGHLLSTPAEDDVYAALGLPWIAPELREDHGEIEAALDGTLPRLVEATDLRGDLHCHTRWTDGTNSLEEMALAARARGYEYMALTDHSRSLQITNGLSLERLEEARRAVEQLNQRLAPFVILLGTEMDILEDGSLDYPDEVLATLDYVSASIHSRFKQPPEVMTQRIERAVRHPLVHTLNHPHGRLLGVRPAYAVDMPRILASAAHAGCALEVSADPARMDLDGDWARRASASGARCTISSDAHSTLDYDNIWLGVGSARRGWLTAHDVVNTRPLADLRAWLQARRSAA